MGIPTDGEYFTPTSDLSVAVGSAYIKHGARIAQLQCQGAGIGFLMSDSFPSLASWPLVLASFMQPNIASYLSTL
jgi:hypothetical protein